MTQAEFDTAFERLQAAFEHPVKDATAKLYYDIIRGYDARDWQQAVHDAIAEDDRWPRVGALLRRLRDHAVNRREREQQARAEAARSRPPQSTPSRLGEVLEHIAPLRDLMAIKRRLQRGEITEAEAERQQQAWMATQPPDLPVACAACRDTGVLHWDEVAPPGHPFAGTRYATAGRCRCAAGQRWDIPFAPPEMQPTADMVRP